jgi:hypothetical protein
LESGRLSDSEHEAAKADVEVSKGELLAALSGQGGASFGPVIKRVLEASGKNIPAREPVHRSGLAD